MLYFFYFYFGGYGQSHLSISQPEVEQEEESSLLISLDEVKAFHVGLAASRAGRLPVQSPSQAPRTRTPCQHETLGEMTASLCHGRRSTCMLQSLPLLVKWLAGVLRSLWSRLDALLSFS